MNLLKVQDTMQYLLLDNQNPVFDIQPMIQGNYFFDYYFAISVFVFGIIGALRLFIKTPVFDNLFFFSFSEQFAYTRFLAKPMHWLLMVSIVLFVSVQVAFIFPFPSFLSFFVAIPLVLLLLLLRIAIYHTLKYLYSTQIDMQYYLYNYLIYLLLLGVLLFFIHCSHQVFNVVDSSIAVLVGIAFFIIFLSIRWIFISVRYQVVKSLYFLLYFCTLEIIPVLLLTQHLL